MADAYIWCSDKEKPNVCLYLFCYKKKSSEMDSIPIDLNLYIEELSIEQHTFEREVLCLQLNTISCEEVSPCHVKTPKSRKLQVIKQKLTSPKIGLRKAKVQPMKNGSDNSCITNSPSTEILV